MLKNPYEILKIPKILKILVQTRSLSRDRETPQRAKRARCVDPALQYRKSEVFLVH